MREFWRHVRRSTEEACRNANRSSQYHSAAEELSSIISRIKTRLKQIFSIVSDSIVRVVTKKSSHHWTRKAARLNFRLGTSFLKDGKLLDAKIRFILAKFFSGGSPICDYYLAIVYYRVGDDGQATSCLQSFVHRARDNKKNRTIATNLLGQLDSSTQGENPNTDT